jgi:hypothetical protein
MEPLHNNHGIKSGGKKPPRLMPNIIPLGCVEEYNEKDMGL